MRQSPAYLALLSQEHLDLSRYELISLGKLKNSRCEDNLVFFSAKIPWQRLAYTKAVYKILAETTPNNLITTLNKLRLTAYNKGTFACRIVRIGEATPLPFSENEFARLIWARLQYPRVDLKNPLTTFVLLLTKKKQYICTLQWTNTDRFEDRRSHLLPEPHPTMMHPRLARSLVNMLNKPSFYDPFCGAGGILLEGGLAGYSGKGSDIDSVQVRRAKINLKHCGVVASVSVKDALQIRDKTKGMATDFPYGKNSRLKSFTLYHHFFLHAQRLTDRIVICLPDFADEQHELSGTSWHIEKTFHVFLHRSLSKKILVLNKKPI
jgi:tRNA (guanine10-N2)-dimethyltransferase